jgi:hypothetical protein
MSSVDGEVLFFWRAARVLRGLGGGKSGSVDDARDDLEVLILHTESETLRRAAAAILADAAAKSARAAAR